MNNDEYKTLQTALKNSALLGVANITKISGWNAAFAIYAAEWWQREYDGSSWKWDKIFASFGASNQELTTPERNQLVKSGLHYWHRKVRISMAEHASCLKMPCVSYSLNNRFAAK